MLLVVLLMLALQLLLLLWGAYLMERLEGFRHQGLVEVIV